MFEIFKSKKNHFIGIDFGTSSIKVVEISFKNQQIYLENYGMVDLDLAVQENAKESNGSTFEQKLNDALKKLLSKMNIDSGAAYVSIPGFSGLITIIELPEMGSEELAKAIKFEAHKYIPSSLDEIAMSWETIGRVEDGQNPTGKKIKVLLVAAPKKDIEKYDHMVSGTQLEVNAIELETFSIARALVDDAQGNFLIVDIGSRATNIILVENGVINVNRNIDAGGNEITNAICDSMGISRQRAEIFKKGERDFLNTTESAIVIPVLELINGESLRIINAYKDKNKNSKIDAVIISGGTARMKGLVEYFSKHLGGIKVELGDPWKKANVDDKVKPFTQKLGGSFTVALGLALRGVEDYKRE